MALLWIDLPWFSPRRCGTRALQGASTMYTYTPRHSVDKALQDGPGVFSRSGFGRPPVQGFLINRRAMQKRQSKFGRRGKNGDIWAVEKATSGCPQVLEFIIACMEKE